MPIGSGGRAAEHGRRPVASRYGKRPPLELELPDTAYHRPSKLNPWRGAKAPGARFTYNQLHVMRELGLDADTVEAVRCRSQTSYEEYHVGLYDSQPVYVFECPVLEHLSNGFRRVISPAGYRKIVHESGRLKKGS